MNAYPEKTAIIILAITLLVGSLVLYKRHTRPFNKITITENGIQEEFTISQVEALLKEKNKIDLNKATAEELQQVPGIGEVMSSRIIEYRNAHGFFSSNEELLNVEGIGEKKFEKIQESLE